MLTLSTVEVVRFFYRFFFVFFHKIKETEEWHGTFYKKVSYVVELHVV